MSELFAANRRVKRGWMNMRVTDIVTETPDTLTFVMVDAEEGGRPFDYVAGQYLTFRFDGVTEKPIVRSYTMSSSPCQPDMSAFTVKRVTGGLVSNWLCDHVKVGTVLRGRGPIGKFCWDHSTDHKNLLMVAGGSGVTPFVSIMREHAPHLGKPGAPSKITLLVSYRSRQDLICWKDLEEIKRLGGQVHVTLSREDAREQGFLHGRISDAMLADVIGGAYQTTTFMTCGPKEIMDMTAQHLRKAGVPEPHIKQESFES